MFTAQQQAIIDHEGGHAKVLASAGSGKTTTMIGRVQKLIGDGVAPASLLSLMFNSDARDSYRAKLRRHYPKDTPPVFTFHGFASRMMNKLVSLGYIPEGQLIVSEYQQANIAKDVLVKYDKNARSNPVLVDAFLHFIDFVKGDLGNPKDFMESDGPLNVQPYFHKAYRDFEKLRKEKGYWFFSDLLYEPIVHLLDFPEHVCLFANHFEHIIVDEFQDVNTGQMELLKLIAGDAAKVMVVGDDDQCIYEWRGAKPGFLISGFDQYFKNPTVFQLPHTFRYGHELAMAAHYLISHNHHRTPKIGVSAKAGKGTTISLEAQCAGQKHLVKEILSWKEQGGKYADIAVLLRAFTHSANLELALFLKRIPYRIDGAKSFLEAPEILYFLSGLHLVSGSFKYIHHRNQVQLATAFVRAKALGLDYERYSKLMDLIKASPFKLDDALFNIRAMYQSTQWEYRRITTAIDSWLALVNASVNSISEAFEVVQEKLDFSSYVEQYYRRAEDVEERIARLVIMEDYADYTELNAYQFGEHLIDMMNGYKSQSEVDCVLLTSIHRSKGMEWPFVIVANMVQGRLPLIPRSSSAYYNAEEERRLLYVAMTRAKEKLVLLAPKDGEVTRLLSSGCCELSWPAARLIDPSQFLVESNLYLCQRAPALVKGEVGILDKVVNDRQAREYLEYHHSVTLA